MGGGICGKMDFTMGLIKYGNGLIELRGRFGGVYFSRDSSGHHMSKMPRTVNYTRSGEQGDNVKAYSECANIWGAVLTGAMLAAWILFGLLWWWTTKDGRRVKLTGWNWFVHYNLRRIADNKDPILWPPDHP